MKKFLFLDFDGVLNSHQHAMMTEEIAVEPKGIPAQTLDEADLIAVIRDISSYNCWNLKFILNEVPDLQIVFSTARRKTEKMETLLEALKQKGIDTTRVIGKTPYKMSSVRSEEISMWLSENVKENEEHMVVVLDDHRVYRSDKPGFFLTDQMVGLTYRDACQVITFLDPKWKMPCILM